MVMYALVSRNLRQRSRTAFRFLRSVFLAGALGGLLGCEGAQFGAREKGALGGAALGAGLGAIVGNQVGNTGAGIAIGSAFGALSGALIGNEIDSTNAGIDEQQARLAANEKEIEENRRIIDELKSQGFDVRRTDRGVVVNLPDVLFAFDRSDLTPSARHTVRDIARAVSDNSKERDISVEGHTDSVGTPAYNKRLSEARARAVAAELSAAGISRPRLRVRGFGESQPLASNETAAGRQRNRRVEVIIEN